MRCEWLELRWMGWGASRRSATRDAVLAKLAASLHSLDDDLHPSITDPENRLFAQLRIEMLESRVALDLGRYEEAMRFASGFNNRFQVLVNFAQEAGLVADNPELWEKLSKINTDRYDEVTAACQQFDG